MPTLILTPRHTADSQALWRAAIACGWDVARLPNWRVPEEFRSLPDPVLYVEAMFGPMLAEGFGLRLTGPPADWLPGLPPEYLKRRVLQTTLETARTLVEPAFIKPPNDKSFPAAVYLGAELPKEYDDATPVLVAEIVDWEKEFRCFVLDRHPRTVSVYQRGGELQAECGFAASESELAEAGSLVRAVLEDNRIELPRAAVLDVGVIAGRGWAVVEANAAWGSGIYGCDPAEVLEILRYAALPA